MSHRKGQGVTPDSLVSTQGRAWGARTHLKQGARLGACPLVQRGMQKTVLPLPSTWALHLRQGTRQLTKELVASLGTTGRSLLSPRGPPNHWRKVQAFGHLSQPWLIRIRPWRLTQNRMTQDGARMLPATPCNTVVLLLSKPTLSHVVCDGQALNF